MSYVDPDYAVAGDPASSDAYNILVDDVKDHEERILGQAFSGALVRRGTNQSISNATWVKASFTGEELDVGGWFAATSTDIIVPASAIPTGFTTIAVEVLENIRFAANGTGARMCRVSVNGTPSDGQPSGPSLASDPTSIVGFDFVTVAAGDVITIEVYQSSGGALNMASARVAVKRLGGVA